MKCLVLCHTIGNRCIVILLPLDEKSELCGNKVDNNGNSHHDTSTRQPEPFFSMTIGRHESAFDKRSYPIFSVISLSHRRF